MIDAIRELSGRLQALDRNLREVKTPRVNRRDVKDEVQNTVDLYFRQVRERLLVGGIQQATLEPCDRLMHALLEATHGRVEVATYRGRVHGLTAALLEIEKTSLLQAAAPNRPGRERIDALIIATLSTLLPSAARSYEQAILDLASAERLSYRGPATDFREALRETLDHLAPDAAVIEQPGFKLEKDATGPTMKQKVRFVLRHRRASRTQSEATEVAADAVDEIVGTFVRSVYTRSNLSTHTPTDRNEVLRVRDFVRTALSELLEVRA